MGAVIPVLLASLLLALPAGAVERTIGADLKFVSEVTAIQPGVPFTIALHIHHHKGFHTYWKAPGIVGLPTSLDWKLPEGFQAAPIEWPAPQVVDMAGHPAHGYRRDVLLLVKITPPEEIAAGEVTLAAEAAWMACAKTCHPGFRTLDLTLPVAEPGQPASPDPVWQKRIAAERAALPGPTKDWNAVVESKPGASPIVLRLAPQPGITARPGTVYFFSEDGQVSSKPLIKTEPGKDGTYRLTLPRCEFDDEEHTHLPGILSATGSWATDRTLRTIRVNPAYPAHK